MSVSVPSARQCLLRYAALAGSKQQLGTISSTRRSIASATVRAQPAPSRPMPVLGAWSLAHKQNLQQQRWFSAGSGKDDDSDDDFKPKRKAVSDNPTEIAGLIQKQVESNPVMLYMKGTPAEPRCGFSSQVVRILHSQGVSFSSVNVLDYPALREGIKAFSEWPTIPQVFVKGEFVGGCDIVSQMHESGELETMFKDAKLRD